MKTIALGLILILSTAISLVASESETGNESAKEALPVQKQAYIPDKKAKEWYLKGYSNRKSNPTIALTYAIKSLQLDGSYYKASMLVGALYSDLKRPDRAIKYFLKSQEILEKRNDTTSTQYARTLYFIGEMYAALLRKREAFDAWEKALTILSSLNAENTKLYGALEKKIATLEKSSNNAFPRQKGLYYKESLEKDRERKKQGGRMLL